MEEYNNILSRYDAVIKQASNFDIDAQRWYTVYDLKCQIALALGADVQDVKDCLSVYDVDYLIYKTYGGTLSKLDLMSDYDVLVATIAILDSSVDTRLIDSEYIAEKTLVDLLVPMTNEYFYLEPLSDNTQFTINSVDGAPVLNLEYSMDGKRWQNWDYKTNPITANATERVYLRGQNEEWTTIVGTVEGNFQNHHYNRIISVNNEQFNIGGRLSSLFTGTEEETDKSIIMSAIFYNSSCRDASELIIPKNAKLSYAFTGCGSLISAPRTLSDSIIHKFQYASMFSDCKSLMNAPLLPATSLAPNCYYSLFNKCTSLETAPLLPATKLASSSYNAMFAGCTSLRSTPKLPATQMATECYVSMFKDCKSLSSFEIPTIQRNATRALNSMLSGCTGLKKIVFRDTWELLKNEAFDYLTKNVTTTSDLGIKGNAGVFVVPGFDMSKEYYSPRRNNRVPKYWKVSGDENDPAFTPYVKLENCHGLTLNRDISGVEYSMDGQNWHTLNPRNTIRPEDFVIYLRSSALPEYGDSEGQEQVFGVTSDGNGKIVMSGNLIAMFDYINMLSPNIKIYANRIFNGLFRDNDSICDISALCCHSFVQPNMKCAFANCKYLTRGMNIFYASPRVWGAYTNLYMGCSELVDAGVIINQDGVSWYDYTFEGMTKYCEKLEHLTISGLTLNANVNLTNGMASDSQLLELRVMPNSNIPIGSEIGVNGSATVTFLTAVG